MAKYVESHTGDTLFLRGTLEELLQEDSLARSVWSAIVGLDFGRFDASYRNDEEGRPAIDPRRLAGVWILALLRGFTSSLELERLCGRDIEFRWMSGDTGVKKSTLSAFRKGQTEALKELSTQVLAALSRSGLLPGKELGFDGTVVKAAASCGASRTRRELRKSIKRLRRVVHRRYAKSEEEERGGKEYQRRKERLESALKEMTELGLTEEEDRVTVTEAEASVKRRKDGSFGPGHNVQIGADLSSGAIISTDVVDAKNDQGQLERQVVQAEEELSRVRDRTGDEGKLETAVTDAGYHDTLDLVALEGRVETFVPDDGKRNRKPPGVSERFLADHFTYDETGDVMICPEGQELRRRKLNARGTAVTYQASAAVCGMCRFRSECCPKTKAGRSVNRPLYAHVTQAVAARVNSDRGKRYKKARHVVLEGAFARMVENLHWRRCRTWGRAGAKAELLWRQITHNLMLLLGHWQPLVLKEPAAG